MLNLHGGKDQFSALSTNGISFVFHRMDRTVTRW